VREEAESCKDDRDERRHRRIRVRFCRPYGTGRPGGPRFPALKGWAIITRSLRDEEQEDAKHTSSLARRKKSARMACAVQGLRRCRLDIPEPSALPVGSIANNNDGGDYGYRLSKAAVNMAGLN
jgi:hypothetical protein